MDRWAHPGKSTATYPDLYLRQLARNVISVGRRDWSVEPKSWPGGSSFTTVVKSESGKTHDEMALFRHPLPFALGLLWLLFLAWRTRRGAAPKS